MLCAWAQPVHLVRTTVICSRSTMLTCGYAYACACACVCVGVGVHGVHGVRMTTRTCSAVANSRAPAASPEPIPRATPFLTACWKGSFSSQAKRSMHAASKPKALTCKTHTCAERTTLDAYRHSPAPKPMLDMACAAPRDGLWMRCDTGARRPFVLTVRSWASVSVATAPALTNAVVAFSVKRCVTWA